MALIAAAGIILFALGQQSSPASPRPHPSPSSSRAVAAALAALLRQGTPDTARVYWEKPSATLEAAAAGADDARFRALGALLVKDGFAGAIINLGREMTGAWYNWSERRCPRAEPSCYILAWRHAVDAMRSVPGQHFRFLWTVYPGTAAAIDAWPGAAYVDLVGTDIYDWYGGPHGTYPHTAYGQLDHDAGGGRFSSSPAASTGSPGCPGSPASRPPSPSGGLTSTASAARTTRLSSPACSRGCMPTTRSASTGRSSTWPLIRLSLPARCWPTRARTRAGRPG